MNCKNCGAPLRLIHDRDYFYCDYCTTYSFPDETRDGVRVLMETSTLKCPVCRLELVKGKFFAFPSLVCTKCRGLLFNTKVFVSALDFVRNAGKGGGLIAKPLNKEELHRQVDCPCCGQQMSTHPYLGGGNIVVDTCVECELLWLDYGELHRVVISSRKNFY